jgi:hypothetical protein
VALSKEEQRICDLAQQINVQQANIDSCNAALYSPIITSDAEKAFNTVQLLRTAQSKLNTLRAEYKQRAHEYLTERMNNTTLTKVLGLNTNAAPMGKS